MTEPAAQETSSDEATASTMRYVCYHCDHGIRTAPTQRLTCPSCDRTLVSYRARIAYLQGNSSLQRLAEGPATLSEVSRSEAGAGRPFLEFLETPTTGGSGSRSRGRTTDVVYLMGDERAAMRLFIEENTDYVASCVTTSPNPLQRAWDDVHWQLLLEQWYWLGYGDDCDDSEADA